MAESGASPRRSSRPSRRYRAAAICTPGLESVCVDELRALGLKPKPAGPGVLEFSASPRQLYASNVWVRTAGRILVRVATFRATDWVHLQDHARSIDWDRWIPPGHAPAFRITSNDSKLYHTKAIAQRLHQVSLPPSIGEPEQMFVVRIDRNTVTISADASGEALHKRRWRTELGRAPLRSSMAAAVLLRSGWGPTSALVDPFCGVGTVAIEAALLSRGLPPAGVAGTDGTFAFQDWPDFEPGAWASVRGTVADAVAKASEPDGSRPLIVGADRDPSVVAMAEANAERAGVADAISFDTRVVAHTRAVEGPGSVVTNPPYGKRMGPDRLIGLYRRLGAVARERLPGFGLVVLTPDPRLARAADSGLRPTARFRHGGLPVELFTRPAAPVAPEIDLSDPDGSRSGATEPGPSTSEIATGTGTATPGTAAPGPGDSSTVPSVESTRS